MNINPVYYQTFNDNVGKKQRLNYFNPNYSYKADQNNILTFTGSDDVWEKTKNLGKKIVDKAKETEENPDYNAVVTELLEQINNCKEDNVLVIIASNEPQKIDNAIKRTGRMDKKIFIGSPDEETRAALFQLYLDKIKKKKNNIDINTLVRLTDYYTAEDIRLLLRRASMKAMRAEKLVDTNFILSEIKNVAPSLNQEIVEDYRTKGNIQ